MILTTSFIISFLATALATPFQRPMTQDTRCANSSNVATCHLDGEYKIQNIDCNNPVQRLQIARSIAGARMLAQSALDYINSDDPQRGVNGVLYTAYWPADQANHADLDYIRDAFTFISNAQEGDRTFDCLPNIEGGLCDGTTTAYNLSGDIHYCHDAALNFYNQGGNCDLCGPGAVPVENRMIRGGTTLHELAHSFDSNGRHPVDLYYDIDDIRYGCARVQTLPPNRKKHNADNYHCFALAVFALTGCDQCP